MGRPVIHEGDGTVAHSLSYTFVCVSYDDGEWYKLNYYTIFYFSNGKPVGEDDSLLSLSLLDFAVYYYFMCFTLQYNCFAK